MLHRPADVSVSAEREPDYEFLDPETLRFFRDDSGRLRLTIQDDRSYLDVKVVRAFPLFDPDHYTGLLNGKDHVIGIVVDPAELDEGSKTLADESLRRHYFTPIIRRIRRMKQEFGAVYCDVDTDHGQRHFVCKGLRDALEDLGNGELILSDVDGNRYRVIDWRALDARSRRFLEQVV